MYMDKIREKKGYICDMDGVIYHGNKLLDGVKEFVEWLQREDKRFLFLTNASSRSPRELHEKLLRMAWMLGKNIFIQVHLQLRSSSRVRLRDAVHM